MPIFHPSYLLRNPSREAGGPKSLTWMDAQEVRRKYLTRAPVTSQNPLALENRVSSTAEEAPDMRRGKKQVGASTPKFSGAIDSGDPPGRDEGGWLELDCPCTDLGQEEDPKQAKDP